MVTDRSLLHAGPTGEIPSLLLAFLDNSISTATGSQCISSLGLPFRTQLKVSEDSSSPPSCVLRKPFIKIQEAHLEPGWDNRYHTVTKIMTTTLPPRVSIFIMIVFLLLANGDLKNCGFLGNVLSNKSSKRRGKVTVPLLHPDCGDKSKAKATNT